MPLQFKECGILYEAPRLIFFFFIVNERAPFQNFYSFFWSVLHAFCQVSDCGRMNKFHTKIIYPRLQDGIVKLNVLFFFFFHEDARSKLSLFSISFPSLPSLG